MTHSVLSSLQWNFYCFIKFWAETFIFRWGHLHSVQLRYLYKVDAIWGILGKCIGAVHILTDIIFLFKYIIFLPKFELSNYENKSLILKTGMSLKLEINTIVKHQMALVLLVCLIFFPFLTWGILVTACISFFHGSINLSLPCWPLDFFPFQKLFPYRFCPGHMTCPFFLLEVNWYFKLDYI